MSKRFSPRPNANQLPAVAQQLADLQKALASLGAQIVAMAAVPEPDPPVTKQQRTLDGEVLATMERELRDPLRILRDKDIARLFSVHYTTVWRWTRTGKMPKPVKIGAHVTGWRAGDIADWLKGKQARE